MALLSEKDAKAVREMLAAAVTEPVKLVMFTQEFECAYCRETRQILEELAELSPLLAVEVHDFEAEKALAEAYGVDKIPAIAVLRAGKDGQPDKDYGIRFFGIPSGYEFVSLLEAIKLVGGAPLSLSQKTLDKLAQLQQPLHIQVFVTPTCPYCPRAVVLAHQLAFASDKVRADMVEATEFPHLSYKYQVMGVPRTVINETIHIEGAVPEAMLVARLPLN
ncbi:MAG: thioredoxin family protein [Caldilineales bacterium]|nr:thioredoxin family protein [Caldilineales bacterium]MDW8317058.1 thioredoxin family protein [Anaerolineae bacterium]